MLLTIASSSPPCSHSASNRLGPTGPFAMLLPWQATHVSVYFAAMGLPRPPPRPCPPGAAGGPCGAPAGGFASVPDGGIVGFGGGCCLAAYKPIVAAKSTVLPK